jgi:hypothetical protein
MAFYVFIFIAFCTLLLWYILSKTKKARSFSLDLWDHKDHEEVIIHPIGDEHLTWLTVSENLPKLATMCENREDFNTIDFNLHEGINAQDIPYTPLSARGIKVQELEAILQKYSFQKDSNILERKYKHDDILLYFYDIKGIINDIYIDPITQDTNIWFIDFLHELGTTWSLSAQERSHILVDLRNRAQIVRYFSKPSPAALEF